MIRIFKFLYTIFSKFYFNITYRTLKKSSKSKEELKQIWKNINKSFLRLIILKKIQVI